MKSALSCIVATLLLASLPADARPPRAIVEDGWEFTASMLNLPANQDGVISVVACSECKRLTISPLAQFFIGKQEVRFAELKRHLDTHPTVAVLLVSPADQPVVTRITASTTDTQ